MQKNESNDSEYIGVLTDGIYKIDMILNKKNDEDISIERGKKIEIICDIQETGRNFFSFKKFLIFIRFLKLLIFCRKIL